MRESGQSLFELLIAVFVVGAVLISLVSLSTRSVSNNTYAENSSEAGRHSQKAMEWLRGERDTDWATFVSHGSTGRDIRYCINTLDWNRRRACADGELLNGEFQREVVFTVVDPSTKVEVEVLTFWTDPNGRHEAQISSVLTNWK